jgi:hypothetical protein
LILQPLGRLAQPLVFGPERFELLQATYELRLNLIEQGHADSSA